MSEFGAEGLIRNVIEGQRKARLRKEFRETTPSDLAALDNSSLAEWQSQYSTDSPQFLLADHEWQRRLTAQQVKAMRFAAYVSLAGVVLGAILTIALRKH
jgi:hypothetical protein